jgi:4-diphosphocytidyl-2-C-methyl-D-erythritol kinase
MFPRKIGSTWEVRSPAKINLYLEIVGRQDSGYHELETLMVPVRLVDTLRWSPELASSTGPASSTRPASSPGPSLHVVHSIRRQAATKLHESDVPFVDQWPSADQWVPADDNNLVIQAAQLLAQRAGIQPHGSFTLIKRIPTRAGLGGGSSDAAATLVLANTVWKLGYSLAHLLEMATELGSDVPFFIATGQTHHAAICRGRGERVEPIGSLGRLHFVLVKPTMGLSTKEIFEKVNVSEFQGQTIQEPTLLQEPTRAPSSSQQVPLQQIIGALRQGALGKACQSMFNRLESIAMTNCDWLEYLRKEFNHCLCCGQWMTGSGSTYVGLVRTAKQAKCIAGKLRARQLGTVYTTTSY